MGMRLMIILLSIIMIFAIGVTGCSDKDNGVANEIGEKAEREGWLKKSDYLKIRNLVSDVISKKRNPTDKEVEWALSLLKQSDNCKTESCKLYNYVAVTDLVELAGPLSDNVRNQVFDFAVKLKDFSCPSSERDCEGGDAANLAHIEAVRLFGIVAEPRCITHLKQLEKRSFKNTHEMATHTLMTLKARGIQ